MEFFALSKPQQAIWNMQQFYGGSVANVTGAAIFTWPVDVAALRDALNSTVRQCDALRLRLTTDGGVPRQHVVEYVPQQFELRRFSSLEEFEKWAQALAVTPFDLAGPLYRFCVVDVGGQTGLVVHVHHLVADAWSMSLLMRVILANLDGESVDVGSYIEHLAVEAEHETSDRRAGDKAYFLSQFEGCREPVHLADRQANNPAARRVGFTIDRDATARIEAFCAAHGVTPYALFMTALGTYLYRIKGASDMYIATTVLNRAGRVEKQTPGVFINTVPVRLHIDDEATSLENLLANADRISGVFRHQKYQYVDVQRDVHEKFGSAGRLYDVALNYQNATYADDRVAVEWLFCGSQGESLALHVNDRLGEGVFHLDYGFQTELFAEADIERLHGHLMNLLFDTIEHPDRKPYELRLLSDAEYQQVVRDFNDTAVPSALTGCVHERFAEQVALTPDAVAVVFHDAKYTYRQIDEMSNCLAHELRRRGVGRDDIVAIVARRSHLIIVAQLAVLKAGGAYLPIDPTYPEARINYMLEDSGCRLALTLGATVSTVPSIDMTEDDVFHGDISDLANANHPGDLCYVIYTSGSTGKPKGVMLRHLNVVNYCSSSANNVVHSIIKPGMGLIVSITTISFDIFVTESLLPLLNGMTVVMADERQSTEQVELGDLVRSVGADVLQTTPTKMQALIADPTHTGYLASLKAVILGGEVLAQPLADRLSELTGAALFNIYGPTETTVWSTEAPVRLGEGITIGKPIANTQVHIVDAHMNPLPISATGELCIAGAGVGRGYLHLPELTAQRFVVNPFGPGMMYRTGDLARWRADGNLEYIGRADDQVKIRGLRVELGEIETAIHECDGIRQVCVTMGMDDTGTQYLCAYYMGDADVPAIRRTLAKRLPQYMIPRVFMPVDRFPKTPSGKTDRKAFPPPDPSLLRPDAEYVPPSTEREQAVVALTEAVLHMERIGVNDNFFDLGGDSLRAIELVSKAHYEGLDFSLQDVFDCPTPAALSRRTTDGGPHVPVPQPDDFADLDALLQGNRVSDRAAPTPQPMGDVLITGATGWLGAHVLHEYLAREHGTACCLVRGTDERDGAARLTGTLARYFGDAHAGDPRIVAVRGDITRPIALDRPVRTVIHCAALVKHFGSYEAFHEVNVDGTKNVIAFARANGARLLHISTASVSGSGFEHDGPPRQVFDETRLFIGQSLDNVYVRSKVEAEVAVLRARLAGLDATVIRVGNLANRRCDLMAQSNYRENATLTRLKGFIDLGLYPEELEDYPLEFSPVDDTARVVVELGRHRDDVACVFHAFHPHAVAFGELARAVRATGLALEPVPWPDFVRAVRDTHTDAAAAGVAEAFVHDIDAEGTLRIPAVPSLANDFTTSYLDRVGVDWPPIDERYLTGYITTFARLGYWSQS